MNKEAWQAAVHGVTNSRTWLSSRHTHFRPRGDEAEARWATKLKTASASGGRPLSELRFLHFLKALLMDSRSEGRGKMQPDLKSYFVLLSANGLQLFLPFQKLVLVPF